MIRAIFEMLKKTRQSQNNSPKQHHDEYRSQMLKQKKDYDEFKKKEGDSDLVFNEKDNSFKEKSNNGN